MPDVQDGYDDQAGAEAFDETNLDEAEDLGTSGGQEVGGIVGGPCSIMVCISPS